MQVEERQLDGAELLAYLMAAVGVVAPLCRQGRIDLRLDDLLAGEDLWILALEGASVLQLPVGHGGVALQVGERSLFLLQPLVAATQCLR